LRRFKRTCWLPTRYCWNTRWAKTGAIYGS
jgi:hypothetical protein